MNPPDKPPEESGPPPGQMLPPPGAPIPPRGSSDMDPGPPPGDPGPPDGMMGPPPGDPGPPDGMMGPPPGDPGPPDGMMGPPPGDPGPDSGPPNGDPGPPAPATFGEIIANLKSFRRFARPVAWAFWAGLVSILLSAILRVPMSYVPTWYEDSLHNVPLPFGLQIAPLIVLALALAVSASTLNFLSSYCGHILGEQFLRDVRKEIFSKLERLGMATVYQKGAGEFVQRLTRDVYSIRDLISHTLIDFVSEATRTFVLLGFACWMEASGKLEPGGGEYRFPILTFMLVVAFAVTMPMVKWLNGKVEVLARRSIKIGEEAITQLVEAIGGYRDIVASGRFGQFLDKFDKTLGTVQNLSLRTAFWGQSSNFVPGVLLSMVVVLPYFMALHENLTEVGPIVTYVALLGQSLPGVMGFFGILQTLSLSNGSMMAVRELLEEVEHSHKLEPVPDPLVPTGCIRLEDVTLEIEGRRILDRVSFELPLGKVSAIVGQSGAGKTTIFHLLLRLIRPTSGRITIDGRPIESYEEAELRGVLGFIPQNPFIFNWTLEENLQVAAEAKGAKELQEAVELSQLSEVVQDRAEEGGLQAVAGYMGMRFSGGEKQRIALGRLILQDPDIIICDEYTANVDVKTARAIQQAMDTRFEGRTQIMVTHQLYSVTKADQIVVIDRGRVIQQGTHEELSQVRGLYRGLCLVQRLI